MRTFRTSGERKTLKDTLPAVLIVLASLLAASGPVWAQTPMSTAFSYQGQIKERGEPVTDAGDFVFQLWDAPIDGRLLATDSIPNVPIADGLFTAQIDFGADFFNGNARWLEITVDLHHGGNATLSPRQPINATPYALYALNSSGGGGDCLWTINGNDIYYSAGNVGIGDYPAASQTLHIEAGAGEYALHAYAGSSAGEITISAENEVPGGRALNGQATGASGTTYGVYGYSESTDGAGVFGVNESSSGAAIGVYGRSSSPTGFGGYFEGRGYFSANVGIGTNSPLYPLHVASTDAYCIYGTTSSPSGRGVYGTAESVTGGATGVIGETSSLAGYGVWGNNNAISGDYAAVGVFGSTDAPRGVGVKGYAPGPDGGRGVWGRAEGVTGRGVYAESLSPTGSTYAVEAYALSPDGFGVYALNEAGTGNATAIRGETYSGGFAGYFVGRGYFSERVGIGTTFPGYPLHVISTGGDDAVAGENPDQSNYGWLGHGLAGVYGAYGASTGNGKGVYGVSNSPDGFGGYFNGRGFFSDNVGIGTTTPGSPLTVAGMVESTADGFKFPDGTIQTTASTGGGGDCLWTLNGSDIYYNAGDVGVGVTSPLAPLHVEGTGTNLLWARNTATEGPAYAVHAYSASTTGFGVYGEAGSTTGATRGVEGFAASPTGVGVYGYNEAETGEAIAVRGHTASPDGYAGYFDGRGYFSGNVGIGTSTPGAELDVVGTARMDGFRLDASPTAGYVLTCDSNGAGTWQEPTGGGGLELPYLGSIDDDSQPGFQVNNWGSGGGIKGVCSDGPGVLGYSDGMTGVGVEAIGNGFSSGAPALRAENTNPAGMAIFSTNNSPATNAAFVNKGSGNIINGFSGPEGDNLVFKVTNDGTTHTNVLQINGGSDLSEQFDVQAAGEVKPGMVVCIDPANAGKLVVSTKAYDRTVAGIVSGAGGVQPGMLMGQSGSVADGQHPIALTGRVYVRADASNGAIEPGDLLTTSSVPGHAMKVGDHDRSHGAILGKAMTNLAEGETGLVLVLVSLQ